MQFSKIFNSAARHLPETLSGYFNDCARYFEKHEQKRILFNELKRDLDNGTISQEDACWRIAASVHGNTLRRDGKPYMSHINAVVNGPDYYIDISYTDDQRKLAIVHDTPEDSVWRVRDFRRLGFSKDFCEGLDAITRRRASLFRPAEKYFDNAERVAKTIALDVKIADNRHNWADKPKPEKALRYRVTSHYYVACKYSRVEPGSSIADFAAKEGMYNEELFSQLSSRPAIPDYSPPRGKEHMASIPAPAAV